MLYILPPPSAPTPPSPWNSIICGGNGVRNINSTNPSIIITTTSNSYFGGVQRLDGRSSNNNNNNIVKETIRRPLGRSRTLCNRFKSRNVSFFYFY